MSSQPGDLIERAEAVEEEVAPRDDPSAASGADPDDGIAPDSVSAND